jgi:hypothetical protein
MKTEVSLSQLQEDIHKALRSWHDAGADSGFFDYLQLFRQARLAGAGAARRTMNEILLAALETLAAEYEESANLLRHHFLDGMLVHAIANRLNIGQSTVYRKQQEALHQLALIIQAREEQARNAYQASLEKRLRLPPEAELFGIEARFADLIELLSFTGTPWLVSIEGLGGIGKTAFANAVVRHAELISRFQDVAWVSVKQSDFFLGLGLEEKTPPALTVDSLIDALLEQLDHTGSTGRSPQEKRLALTWLLKQAPYLIVVDNLETMLDYQALLPLLGEITNPSKVLLTSRHSLREYPNIFCLTLAALDQADTFDLIRHEANTRGLALLARAADPQLERIFDVVGGNPLALKLMVGQTAFLPLAQVLDSLKEARGKTISELYTYIYWQAWHMMADVSRQTLLVMPLTQKGTLKQLLALSRLELAELQAALQQLATLSLLQVEGDLDERRYSIHRLTETFLLSEAITWGSSA